MSNTVASDKLAKLQAANATRVGGMRRKVKKTGGSGKTDGSGSAGSAEADKKVSAALKKVNGQIIPGLEQVNLFKEDGNIIHFSKPTVQASVGSNAFFISGHNEEKSMAEMVPDILNQLGADSIANLRRLAESFQNRAGMTPGKGLDDEVSDDDDIPELVDEVAQVSVSESN